MSNTEILNCITTSVCLNKEPLFPNLNLPFKD